MRGTGKGTHMNGLVRMAAARVARGFVGGVAAIVATLALALGMAARPALAADATATGSITVTSDENSTSTLYRIISVSSWDGASAPVYTWDASVAAWLKDSNGGNHADWVGTDNVVTSKFNVTDDGKNTNGNPDVTDANNAAAQFFGQLSAAIKAGTVTVDTAAVTAGVESGQTVDNLTQGSYLIVSDLKAGVTDKASIRIYNPTVVNLVPVEDANHAWSFETARNVNVTIKSSTPTISKQQNADGKGATTDDATIGVGKSVTYTLTATVPAYPASADAAEKTFQVVDTMSKGLAFDANSVKVMAGTAEVTNLFTVKVTGDATNGTTITFAPTNGYDGVAAYANQALTITYNATVTKDAVVHDAMTNGATLEYGNDYNVEGNKVKLYTFGLDVLKYDASDNTQKPLDGAEFTLSTKEDGSNPISFVKDADGVYHVAGSDEQGATTTLAATNGTLALSGLDAGTYYLTETKAPAGYQKLTKPAKVTITAGKDGAVTETNPNNKPGFSYVSISNTKGFSLPQTGGMGGLLLTAVAVLLLGGGISIAVNRRPSKGTRARR